MNITTLLVLLAVFYCAGALASWAITRKRYKAKFEAFRTNLINNELKRENVEIQYIKVSTEISERNITASDGRYAIGNDIARSVAKMLVDQGLINFKVTYPAHPGRALYLVEAELRALPSDKKKPGEPFIYVPNKNSFR